MFGTTSKITERCVNEVLPIFEKNIKEMVSIITKWWDAFRAAVIPKKWEHYARYSKRARIRKKYNDKIQQRWESVKEGLCIG